MAGITDHNGNLAFMHATLAPIPEENSEISKGFKIDRFFSFLLSDLPLYAMYIHLFYIVFLAVSLVVGCEVTVATNSRIYIRILIGFCFILSTMIIILSFRGQGNKTYLIPLIIWQVSVAFLIPLTGMYFIYHSSLLYKRCTGWQKCAYFFASICVFILTAFHCFVMSVTFKYFLNFSKRILDKTDTVPAYASRNADVRTAREPSCCKVKVPFWESQSDIIIQEDFGNTRSNLLTVSKSIDV